MATCSASCAERLGSVIDEMVAVGCPSGCGQYCGCGKSKVRLSSTCVARGISYKLLTQQPPTPREKREQERERAEVATQRTVIEKLFGKRGLSQEKGLGGAKVHLSQAERKSIENFTGVKVFDAQDARRALKAKGMRFLERGEETEAMLDAHVKWADSDGEKRGAPLPKECEFPGWDAYGIMPKVPVVDWQERLAYHQAREREKARDQET